MKRAVFLLMLAGLLGACQSAPQYAGHTLSGRTVASAYGFEEFDRIEAIRYTFNVELPDRRISRSWIWYPAEDTVVHDPGAGGESTTYKRNRLSGGGSEALRAIDAGYINDRYWLLFPFHLVWDRDARIEDAGIGTAPISRQPLQHLVVRYPSKGGYTPGDVYELFIDGNQRIAEWIYRKAGSPEPTRITTWDDHRRVGPLTLSLDHRGIEGPFRVWFTDVAVKLKGEDRWHEAVR